MSLMSALYTGNSGLQTAQNALNTTAHNMSNIDTAGYTRQQISLGTRDYITLSKTDASINWSQHGIGVGYIKCKQVRDQFLDQSYRMESGRSEFYNVSTNCLLETADLLQEMNGAEFAESLSNLWVSVQELDKDPSAVNMNSFVTRSNEFLTRAQAVYDGLISYQQNMNSSVKKIVEEINDIGDKINELNKKILSIELGGHENANDLRDQRNKLLDTLGGYGNIFYEEDKYGIVTVMFEGAQYVTSDHCNHIALDITESPNGYYTPYWEYAAKEKVDPGTGETYLDISGAKLYDLTQTISTAMKTDVGQLRGTLLARGDHAATYHDIQGLLPNPEPEAERVKEYYNRSISQSVIMNVQAEFDQLVHSVMSQINEVLVNSRSNYATMYNNRNGLTYGDPGALNPEDYQMFVLKNPNDHLNYAMKDAKNVIIPGHDRGDIETGYTTSNSKINQLFMQEPTLLGLRDEEQQEENDTTGKLKAAFTETKYTLNPNVSTPLSLTGYYNALVSQVANSGSVYQTITQNQERTVAELDNARTQVTGVSSDEELEFMIEFQNAFNASSRYINVISEMLEHIINTLGMM